jgi:hypothetical protein
MTPQRGTPYRAGFPRRLTIITFAEAGGNEERLV